MGQSRKDLFEKAGKLRKKEKEKESSGFEGGAYEEVVYTALEQEEDKVVRIIGSPLQVREKGTDPKLSYISMIMGDNGKKFRCIWPDKTEDSSWILWSIYDKVLSYDWDSSKNVKRFHNADSHPECFRRVAKNNSDNQFEQGWKPSKFVHMNIIDRHDMDWHRENKHYKVLSKKASEAGERIWFEPGIPEYLYQKIWDGVVEYNGDWHNYDVALRKLSANPWYEAFHAIDDQKKIQKDVLDLISDQDLTEEEFTWEGYDFDKLFPVTSYAKIKSRLGKFIQRVDLDFNTGFYDELLSLVEIEEQNREKVSGSKSVVVNEKDDDDEDDYQEEEVDLDLEEEEQAPPTRSRVREKIEIDWDGLADGSFNGTEYKGVPEMTDDEKAMVLSVKDNGAFKYVEKWNGSKVSLLQNPSSDFISPEEFHVDPLSGEVFE